MTRGQYMEQLKNALRWKCGRKQRDVILEDYHSAFENGAAQGISEETLCNQFGSPRMAARALLREDWTPVWAMPRVRILLLAAVCCTLAALRFGGNLAAQDAGFWVLLIVPGIVYMALGREPQRISGKSGLKGLCLSLYVLAFLCLLALCIGLEHLTALYNLYHGAGDGGAWREMVNQVIQYAGIFAAAAALGGWILSLRVFPGSVFALFGLFSVGLAAETFTSLCFPDGELGRITFDYGLSLVFFGLILALLFSCLLRLLPHSPEPCPEPGRAQRVGMLVCDPVRSLFLENLSYGLKFKFSRWEKWEILGDYEEAFEIGLREGRSSQSLCIEFGSPEAIAAILSMERRGRFLAFPTAKIAAMAVLTGLLLLLYCRAEWWTYLLPTKTWMTMLLVAALPPLALQAIGGRPMKRGGGKILLAFYACALPALLFFPLLLADLLFQWNIFPVISGAPCMAALFTGFAVMGAVTFVELRVYPLGIGRLPLLFVNAGYVVTNAALGNLLRLLADPEEMGTLLVQSFMPLALGLILALLCYLILRRPGVGQKLGVPTLLGNDRQVRIERVRRVSRMLAMA